uniref:Elongation factor 1-beta n=1 Tax=Rhabditophanes sp. KR3021 TaxID=114890 RepID=A0AC35U2P2_9BILA
MSAGALTLLGEITPFFPSPTALKSKEHKGFFAKAKTALAEAKSLIVNTLDNITHEDPTLELVRSNKKLVGEVKLLKEAVDQLVAAYGANAFVAREGEDHVIVDKAEDAKSPEAAEDFDLFDSDEESDSEAKKKITEERLKAYHAKKATKTAVIAKSSVILDIKPWDDTTDMAKMEEEVKKITMDGLVWGGAKLIPLAYGIKKLQIIIVIEDDKVSTEDLIELITTDLEEYVQSVDIHAFNKI